MPSYTENGTRAERFAAGLLSGRGYSVEDLNATRRNHPFFDLRCEGADSSFLVSVKSGWSPNRQVRLGSPHILAQFPDEAFFLILMPAQKGEELRLERGGYVSMIVPGKAAKDDALAAHYHYASYYPGSIDHSVMIKDKIDRSPLTRSGSVFHSWMAQYLDAWHLLPRPASKPKAVR